MTDEYDNISVKELAELAAEIAREINSENDSSDRKDEIYDDR